MLPLLALSVILAQAPSQPLTVSAAVSLTEALEDVAGAYRAAGGGAVVFNFAGSNTLARQIVSGAPVDVFVSADEAQMDVVERAGLVAAGTRAPISGNQLVIVVGHDGRTIAAAQDLARQDLRRVAIGDPAAVPAGVYARRYLQQAGLWPALEPKIVPSANVRAALTAVQNGSVDAAIVYATDAKASSRVRVAVTIAGPAAPVIVYPAAAISASRHPADAARFIAFLRGPAAQRILAGHGFTPVPARPSSR